MTSFVFISFWWQYFAGAIVICKRSHPAAFPFEPDATYWITSNGTAEWLKTFISINGTFVCLLPYQIHIFFFLPVDAIVTKQHSIFVLISFAQILNCFCFRRWKGDQKNNNKQLSSYHVGWYFCLMTSIRMLLSYYSSDEISYWSDSLFPFVRATIIQIVLNTLMNK